MTEPEPGRYMRVQDAAAALGVHPNTVRNWLAAGVLTASQTPGGQHRIHAEAVEALAITRTTRAQVRGPGLVARARAEGYRQGYRDGYRDGRADRTTP